MPDDTAPIGTQVATLATRDPDAPAVTCSGQTLTRRELDLSTNRLARAFAERGVRVGDYVTIVLPNSIQWAQSVLAAWKLGATPQPLSARLPDAEFEALLDLRSQALIVGRDDPRGKPPACHCVSRRIRRCPTTRFPRWCHRCGSRWRRAAAPAGPS